MYTKTQDLQAGDKIMSDMSSMNRESKKQQLRSQMITSGQEYPPSRRRMEEEEMHVGHQKKRRRYLGLGTAILLLILARGDGFTISRSIVILVMKLCV